MGTFANSEDPNEMPQIAAFHLGLHCLLRQNCSPIKERNAITLILRLADFCLNNDPLACP